MWKFLLSHYLILRSPRSAIHQSTAIDFLRYISVAAKKCVNWKSRGCESAVISQLWISNNLTPHHSTRRCCMPSTSTINQISSLWPVFRGFHGSEPHLSCIYTPGPAGARPQAGEPNINWIHPILTFTVWPSTLCLTKHLCSHDLPWHVNYGQKLWAR